jgi:hypothetical protein
VRSRSNRPLCALLMMALLLAQGVTSAADKPRTRPPTDAQVTAALEKLKQDPNLATSRKIRGLHWAGTNKSDDRIDTSRPGWMEWLDNLFAWISESGRLLVWVACTIVVGLLGIYLIRLTRERRAGALPQSLTAPTHVRDLDIRPESLPDDVGAASRTLWDRGEHRAALSLLYRGCLSRLAHVHGVPIQDSTTEGECVVLAAGHLSSDSAAYAAQLVRVWQRAVYRGEEPSVEVMYALCEGFRGALDPEPTPQPSELAA